MEHTEFESHQNARAMGVRMPLWYLASTSISVPVKGIEDIVKARQAGLKLVQDLGFSESRLALVITAISELARNMVLYADCGEIALSKVVYRSRDAIMVIAEDRGPGIADLETAISGGYSTSGGWGLGLSGLSHIADEFEIKSYPGVGTEVIVIITSA